jgi:hypothetical protein
MLQRSDLPKGGNCLKKYIPYLAVVAIAVAVIAATPADKSKTFSVTADTIEGCSCPLFCTCYFGPSADEHMCQFNNVYKFRPGSHYGDVDLSNQLVWMSGDLGGEWHHKPGPGMPLKWAVVTFDKHSTPAQKKAIEQVIHGAWDVKWNKFETREDSISWHDDAKMSHAKMGSGLAEIQLDKTTGFDQKSPSVVKNLAYWFTNSNDGFVLAYSTHSFNGDNKFSYTKRNGFNVTWTLKGDVKPAATKAAMP